jgi:aspartate aminotransferase
MQAIVDVAAEEDIYILSDEIYEKLVYDDVKHVSIGSLSKEAYDLTITVNGFSKSYAMTGWRLGYLAAPEDVAKAVDSIQSHSTSHPASFVHRAGLAALKGDQQPLAAMREDFDLRRTYMFNDSNKIPKINAVKREGVF